MPNQSDVEIVWLRFYSVPELDGDHEFRAKHAEILKSASATLGSSREELDKDVLQESYTSHLANLGLLKGEMSLDTRGRAKVDSAPQITSLGRLLLRTIGISEGE
jgi:hypothetical protein